ncbi:hypothetical protein D3C83_195180 [compost metagenome]
MSKIELRSSAVTCRVRSSGSSTPLSSMSWISLRYTTMRSSSRSSSLLRVRILLAIVTRSLTVSTYAF